MLKMKLFEDKIVKLKIVVKQKNKLLIEHNNTDQDIRKQIR